MAVEMPSLVDNLIDLKPDSSLLEANFDGYKLSLDAFPCFDVHLPAAVRVLQTTNVQYGLEHVKLFGDINYLMFDAHTSNNVTRRFYTIVNDLRVCCISFNLQQKKFLSVETVSAITLPVDVESREERYPATISFPDHEFAIVANGYGLLSMFITGDRSANVLWKECLNTKPLLHDDDSGAFIISESRRSSDNCVEVLLRTVVPKERPSSKAHFWNKLFWLTITNEGDGWRVGRAREVTCEGHVEMATFDSTVGNLIVASCGNTMFTADSERIISKSNAAPLVENDSGQIVEEPVEGDKKAYVWTQDREDVTAVFSVADCIHKDDVSMSLSGSNIRLAIKGTLLIEGRLGGPIDTDASTYTLDKNTLELTLSKSSINVWTELVVGDVRGAYEESKDTLLDAAHFIERFTADTEVVDKSGTRKSFNTEQLEDCDMSDEEIYRIRWLCGETHIAKYTSDITGHNVLFAVALGVGAKCICLRMDVDGILWALDCCQDNLAVHRATFNAFGYVQASKTQRKFCTCPPDCSYAVIVEDKRHAFVYWQSTAVDTDLRHRESGRRIAAVAKQSLISLSKVDSMGDKVAVPEDIVGVYADNSALFILTTADLFAVVLK